MAEPLVSIITPTYRRPGYLRETLASATRQTYQNLQIIVRDNASGDETEEVVRSFADARIEFSQATQTGTAWENGNECLRRVRGKYFFPLCDDDLVSPNYIETLVDILERDPQVLAAYGATHIIDENGEVIGKHVPNGDYLWGAQELVEAWCSGKLPLASGINFVCPTWFIRGQEGRNGFVNGHHTDNAIFMSAGIQGKVSFTDKCIFYYRKYRLNSERFARYQDRLEADRQFLNYLDEEVDSELNVGLPRAKWPALRDRLQALLASNYFDLVRAHHLSKETLLHSFRATTLKPPTVYGLRHSLRQSRTHSATILHRFGSMMKKA